LSGSLVAHTLRKSLRRSSSSQSPLLAELPWCCRRLGGESSRERNIGANEAQEVWQRQEQWICSGRARECVSTDAGEQGGGFSRENATRFGRNQNGQPRQESPAVTTSGRAAQGINKGRLTARGLTLLGEVPTHSGLLRGGG
jgi:hypothetical protein